MSIARKLVKLFKKNKVVDRDETTAKFKIRYTRFRDLLESNAELAKLMADLESKKHSRHAVSFVWLKSQMARVMFHTSRMVQCLSDLSGTNHSILFDRIKQIQQIISSTLEVRHSSKIVDYTLSYNQINKNMIDIVGGKNANLGEIHYCLQMRIPEGFAITTKAYEDFLDENDLRDEISKVMLSADSDDPKSISLASEDIQKLIINGHLSSRLQTELMDAYEKYILTQCKYACNVAMRSSAIGEDGDLSYAGQYLSMLNVSKDKIHTAYKYIIASLYTPRAIMYRLTNGVPDDAISMSVACIRIINAKSGGVLYTRNPNNSADNNIVVTSVFGLGTSIVDGKASPDIYLVSRANPTQIVHKELSSKEFKISAQADGSLLTVPVEESIKDTSSLDDSIIHELSAKALQIEAHYGLAQDIEFAVDETDTIYFLQTRPLALLNNESRSTPPIPGKVILLDKSDTASHGIATGCVRVISNYEDLNDLQDNTILVAKHSSPKFMLAIHKLKAIVTDFGSVTGHMAALARESKLPALVNTKIATSSLTDGQVVTVDANSGRVYAGKIDELMAMKAENSSVVNDNPIQNAMNKILDLILPLNLVDPKSTGFSPEKCVTAHDIMRYVHEKSYSTMFQISDMVSGMQGCAYKLIARLPLDLYVIDLGEGLVDMPDCGSKIRIESIKCVPFAALLTGACDSRLCYKHPRAINVSGFMSVMSQQMLSPQHDSDRFGDKSYALISDKYMNFSSRVGYHYGVVDAYCGETTNKNYITFSFKGGAADDVKRERRARSITMILRRLDFEVECVSDRVDAKFQKYSKEIICEKLVEIGKLLMFTRQMDMLMTTESSIDLMANAFSKGDYNLEQIN